MSDLDALRERHRKVAILTERNIIEQKWCVECRTDWPCDTRVVLDALDAVDVAYAEEAKCHDTDKADADRLAEALRACLVIFQRDGWNTRPDIANAVYPARAALRQYEAAKEAERE